MKKKQRRWKNRAAAAGLLVLMFAAGGCTNKGVQVPAGNETAASQPGEAQEEPLKVGISIYRYDDKFMTLYRGELEQYLTSEHQAEVLMEDAKGDQERQNEQIDAFLEEDCDVLILNLVQASETESVVEKCRMAGVPVVLINREPEPEEIQRWEEEKIAAAYVGADARQSGTYQGEIILAMPDQGDINGDGVVAYAMIQGDEENVDAQYRTEYAIKALKEGGMKPKELFSGRGDWEEERGYELATEALEHYGKRIEVMFCNNDAMANGARRAIQEAGRMVGKDIYLVGVDALEETVGYVKEGSVTGTVWNDYVKQSHTAADVAADMAAGEKTDWKYTVDYVKIMGEIPLEETTAETTEEVITESAAALSPESESPAAESPSVESPVGNPDQG